MTKQALITGVTGQDGYYLSKHLRNMGYAVYGTTRDKSSSLAIKWAVEFCVDKDCLLEVNPHDFQCMKKILLKFNFDVIVHLACQSSVGESFEQPKMSVESSIKPTLNLLECIRVTDINPHFLHSSSSECFAGNPDLDINENSLLYPISPYAVGKASSSHLVSIYQKAYGLNCRNVFLTNHESVHRPSSFVIPKLIRHAFMCANHKHEVRAYGDLNVERDWGLADDFMKCLSRICDLKFDGDVFICTGESKSLFEIGFKVFEFFGLEFEQFVNQEVNLHRPNEHSKSNFGTEKLHRLIGYAPKVHIDRFVTTLCEDFIMLEKSRTND